MFLLIYVISHLTYPNDSWTHRLRPTVHHNTARLA